MTVYRLIVVLSIFILSEGNPVSEPIYTETSHASNMGFLSSTILTALTKQATFNPIPDHRYALCGTI